MTKRYAGEPIEKPVVGDTKTIHLRWRGSGKPQPPAAQMVEKINALHQPGLTATATKDPEVVQIKYDSYDDLEALAALQRREKTFGWRLD